jgi:hypothetical protein
VLAAVEPRVAQRAADDVGDLGGEGQVGVAEVIRPVGDQRQGARHLVANEDGRGQHRPYCGRSLFELAQRVRESGGDQIVVQRAPFAHGLPGDECRLDDRKQRSRRAAWCRGRGERERVRAIQEINTPA